MSPDYVPDFPAYVLPYVKWYQDDFVGGVRGMRAHEIGIYTMLLMEMYARGRALDMSDDRLARLCGSDKRVCLKAIDLLVSDGKIIRLNCGLWNERCEISFRERAKMQQQQKSAGEASAEKRRKIKGQVERPFNDRSTSVQPSSEAQIYSDTNVSGANAAPADFKKAVFDEGSALIMRLTGSSRKTAGGIIGKWRQAAKDDDAKILSKIRAAVEGQVADPVAWITAALKTQSDHDFIWQRG